VVLEEADESAFWLEVVTESEISKKPEALHLLDEANQLTAIFAASTITARGRLNLKSI
jgi:DNA-binding LacI/PurR family transcriptional regulator